MDTLKAKFPKGKIYLDKDNMAYIVYSDKYVNKFNNDLNKVQAYIDETVAKELSGYVSFKTGVQEKSIILATNYGSGIVTIGVPYAHYQAYSPRINKREGKRGTYPFERMVADKKETILKQASELSRRLNNG